MRIVRILRKGVRIVALKSGWRHGLWIEGFHDTRPEALGELLAVEAGGIYMVVLRFDEASGKVGAEVAGMYADDLHGCVDLCAGTSDGPIGCAGWVLD